MGNNSQSSTSSLGGHLESNEEVGRKEFLEVLNMGSGQSAEIPGGGSEGYHVLRVISD